MARIPQRDLVVGMKVWLWDYDGRWKQAVVKELKLKGAVVGMGAKGKGRRRFYHHSWFNDRPPESRG